MMACSSAETEPVKKKRKTGRDDSDIFDEFHSKFLTENPSFVDAVNKFKQEITALGAYEIGSCNAADPDNGYCFTKADCTLKPTQRKFAFGNLFIEAFKMLKNFITKKEIPTDSQTKMTLELLVKFLLNEEIQEGLSRTKECDDETELTVLLAFHLFSQLSTSPYFTIDNRKANQIKVCPCGKRHGQIVYGDTSIGNLNVWHGYLDLIMEGAEVIITIDGEQETYKDVESAVEVKQRHFEMNDNSAGSSLVQVAAKTIVYSFYYREKLGRPERDTDLRHGICPSLSTTNEVKLGTKCSNSEISKEAVFFTNERNLFLTLFSFRLIYSFIFYFSNWRNKEVLKTN
ncbi:uncharacterized protein LOC134687515 isoform X2 [Mytilus trossulus]|uniref:uncharacterized protein LOC134687515 isoform X2 n=1 Tax=Mytilus trossulus TaxID=6551 RepID=UPI003005C633